MSNNDMFNILAPNPKYSTLTFKIKEGCSNRRSELIDNSSIETFSNAKFAMKYKGELDALLFIGNLNEYTDDSKLLISIMENQIEKVKTENSKIPHIDIYIRTYVETLNSIIDTL